MIKNLLLSFVTLLACIVLGEIALRLFTPFPIHSGRNKVFDDRLLYVLDPRLNDVDENGFRNPAVPERVDIVAIGDSHTYGSNVSSPLSWPYQLGRMTRKSVYNFGVGSYGVYQYYELFRRALEFQPEYVLIGFYLPNDLARRSCDVLTLDYWGGLSKDFGLMSSSCRDALGEAFAKKGKLITFQLKSSFRLILLSTAISSAYKYYSRRIFPGRKPDEYFTMTKGSASLSVRKRAVLNTSINTDLNSRLIAEAFFNSKILFNKMAEMARNSGITLGILFIPSKERVFYRWALREGVEVPAEIALAVENEDRLAELYRAFFEESSVTVVDATEQVLEVLNDSLSVNEPLYRVGHPVARGYEAYARAALEFFE